MWKKNKKSTVVPQDILEKNGVIASKVPAETLHIDMNVRIMSSWTRTSEAEMPLDLGHHFWENLDRKRIRGL